MNTEKVSIKESELNQLITDTTKEEVGKVVGASIEEKLNSLIEGQKETVGSYVADALKEQMSDILAKIKPDVELEEADEKAKFKTFGEYLTSIRTSRQTKKIDERLTYVDGQGNIQKTAGHMEESEDTQGGFLVPEIFRPDLKMIALENSVVRARATVLPPVRTDSLKIPYVADTTHTSTVYGGVLAYWTAERGTKQATKPAFGQMELVPHKLAGITYTSHELRADSAIALDPLIKRMFGTAWGYYEDDAFIVGTGAGQPLGILNCNCTINNLRNTANRVMLEDLAEMYMRMLPASHPYAVWVINPTVIPELIEMGSGNAADASGKNLVWIDRVQDGLVWKIFGRPVIISEKMSALGTAGDIGYFDLRYYLIFDRQPITIDMSTHVAFTTDEDCWRFVLRVAGQCWPQSDITMRRGGTTQSPFVILSAATS